MAGKLMSGFLPRLCKQPRFSMKIQAVDFGNYDPARSFHKMDSFLPSFGPDKSDLLG